MENGGLGLVKKKVVILPIKFITKNPQNIKIKIYIFSHSI
jgi:hypothetical protein